MEIKDIFSKFGNGLEEKISKLKEEEKRLENLKNQINILKNKFLKYFNETSTTQEKINENNNIYISRLLEDFKDLTKEQIDKILSRKMTEQEYNDLIRGSAFLDIKDDFVCEDGRTDVKNDNIIDIKESPIIQSNKINNSDFLKKELDIENMNFEEEKSLYGEFVKYYLANKFIKEKKAIATKCTNMKFQHIKSILYLLKKQPEKIKYLDCLVSVYDENNYILSSVYNFNLIGSLHKIKLSDLEELDEILFDEKYSKIPKGLLLNTIIMFSNETLKFKSGDVKNKLKQFLDVIVNYDIYYLEKLQKILLPLLNSKECVLEGLINNNNLFSDSLNKGKSDPNVLITAIFEYKYLILKGKKNLNISFDKINSCEELYKKNIDIRNTSNNYLKNSFIDYIIKKDKRGLTKEKFENILDILSQDDFRKQLFNGNYYVEDIGKFFYKENGLNKDALRDSEKDNFKSIFSNLIKNQTYACNEIKSKDDFLGILSNYNISTNFSLENTIFNELYEIILSNYFQNLINYIFKDEIHDVKILKTSLMDDIGGIDFILEFKSKQGTQNCIVIDLKSNGTDLSSFIKLDNYEKPVEFMNHSGINNLMESEKYELTLPKRILFKVVYDAISQILKGNGNYLNDDNYHFYNINDTIKSLIQSKLDENVNDNPIYQALQKNGILEKIANNENKKDINENVQPKNKKGEAKKILLALKKEELKDYFNDISFFNTNHALKNDGTKIEQGDFININGNLIKYYTFLMNYGVVFLNFGTTKNAVSENNMSLVVDDLNKLLKEKSTDEIKIEKSVENEEGVKVEKKSGKFNQTKYFLKQIGLEGLKKGINNIKEFRYRYFVLNDGIEVGYDKSININGEEIKYKTFLMNIGVEYVGFNKTTESFKKGNVDKIIDFLNKLLEEKTTQKTDNEDIEENIIEPEKNNVEEIDYEKFDKDYYNTDYKKGKEESQTINIDKDLKQIIKKIKSVVTVFEKENIKVDPIVFVLKKINETGVIDTNNFNALSKNINDDTKFNGLNKKILNDNKTKKLLNSIRDFVNQKEIKSFYSS